MERWKLAAFAAFGVGSVVAFVACGDSSPGQAPESTAANAQALTRLEKARAICSSAGALDGGAPPGSDAGAPPSAAALGAPKDVALNGYTARPGAFVPDLLDTGTPKRTRVTLPSNATGEWTLEDAATQLSVRARLRGATSSPGAQTADGVLVYGDALGPGADVFFRARPEGFEDFVYLPKSSSRSDVVYDVVLNAGIVGVRSVANTVEFLDKTGTPRLRINPPSLVDASCTTTYATLSVEGCAFDANPDGPWGRAVTPPGASSCAVRVAWDASKITFPAVLDPSWTTTASTDLGTRGGHEGALLSTGKVLIAGNSNGGAPTTSAVLYDPATQTVSPTGSLAQGRYFHQITALSSGQALACGGYSPAGAVLGSCELYASGVWTTKASMLSARARHQTAKVWASTSSGLQQYVLVAGSDATTGTVPAPERYNLSTNTWSLANSGFPSLPPSRSALTELPNGTVLHTGGRMYSFGTPYGIQAVYRYAPNTNSWTLQSSSGALKVGRYGHSTVLAGSKVIIAGGFEYGTTELQSSETWDTTTSICALSGNLKLPRGESTLLLDNLGVPFLHGSGWSQTSNTTERWDAATNLWSYGPSLPGTDAWFYYARSFLAPTGNIVSLGVNLSSTFNPLGVARLGLACPDPLPAPQACWTPAVCDAGNYTAPTPITNVCCQNGTPAAPGASCGDTNPCNGTSTCDGAGACVTTPAPDPGTVCVDPNIPSTQPSPCRQKATCDGASCIPGTQLPPGASCGTSPCSTSTCTAAGACQLVSSLPNGTRCQDPDPSCRKNDACVNGACVKGATINDGADDHNPCTIDSCNGTPVNTWSTALCAEPPNLAPDATNAGGMGVSTAFLYQGASASQQGVTAAKIDEARVAVVRGRVLREDAQGSLVPAQGVSARILGDADYGATLTRADGFYDLAVNGGSAVTVVLEASDMLRIQRTVTTKPHGWSVVDDVVATKPLHASGSFVPNGTQGQVIVGTLTGGGPGGPEYLDADGPRRARLYVPAGTHIKGRPDLDPHELRFDVTEFTRGVSGLKRMPGELPALVGYTYAADITLRDASCLADATCTEDTMPVIPKPEFVKADGTTSANVYLYVDNFVGVNPAKQVPTGSYDRDAAVWRSEPSGKIINPAAPPVAGGDFSEEERTAVLGFTPAIEGGTLLRSPLAHLSAWDCNWGIAPPAGAGGPGPLNPGGDPDDPCEASGSIIGCETQSLGEEIPVVGTPWSLRYQSDRTPGYRPRVTFGIGPGQGTTTAPSKVLIEVIVAGRKHTYERVAPNIPAAGDTFTFVWDGLDAYGREVFGTQLANIRVG